MGVIALLSSSHFAINWYIDYIFEFFKRENFLEKNPNYFTINTFMLPSIASHVLQTESL